MWMALSRSAVNPCLYIIFSTRAVRTALMHLCQRAKACCCCCCCCCLQRQWRHHGRPTFRRHTRTHGRQSRFIWRRAAKFYLKANWHRLTHVMPEGPKIEPECRQWPWGYWRGAARWSTEHCKLPQRCLGPSPEQPRKRLQLWDGRKETVARVFLLGGVIQ